MRLVSAEFLKLRKRIGIVLIALGLTVVPALIMLAVTGGGDFRTGGMRSYADQIGVVAMLVVVCGILVGATIGTADVTSGVFRDLVVTGRSRLDLYAARVPAGLALVLVAAGLGFGDRRRDRVPVRGVDPGDAARVRDGRAHHRRARRLRALARARGRRQLRARVRRVRGDRLVRLLDRDPARPVARDHAAPAELRSRRLAVRRARVRRARPDAAHRSGGRRGGRADVAHRRASRSCVAWTTIPLLAGAWRTMTRDA